MSFWDKIARFLLPPENGGSQAASEEGLANQAAASAHPTRVDNPDGAPAGVVELDISLQTDLGMVRTNNEDRGLYKCPSDPATAAAKGTLIIVADGMGGASAGEVASEMAIRMIPDLYYNSKKAPALAIKEALESTSAEIYRAAQADPVLRGMGTTCVTLAILPPEVFMAYVGDSRLYLLRDENFYQLTEDHSVVFEMVRNGIITSQQARNHEDRNILSLSMGGRPEIAASYWERPMIARAGDRFLACTDGLHDLVSDSEMQAIIADTAADTAVRALIDAAKRHGGHDNITAALVHFRTKIESDTASKPTRELLISE